MSLKSIGGALLRLAIGLAIIAAAGIFWNEFRQLEAGEIESMKLWAPLAALYNLGGIWSTLAKWLTVVLFALIGLVIAGLAVREFFVEQPNFAESPAAANADQFDARYTLSVTQGQIALEDTVEVQGPKSTFTMRLNKSLKDQDRLRFEGEGFEGKGDLYVVIQVRAG